MNTETRPSAEETRALLATDPSLSALASFLRDRFGSRLVELKVGDREIGWSKYRDSVRHAIAWEGSAKWFQEAKAEWKHIKAETIAAGELARRKPSLRKSGVVR